MYMTVYMQCIHVRGSTNFGQKNKCFVSQTRRISKIIIASNFFIANEKKVDEQFYLRLSAKSHIFFLNSQLEVDDPKELSEENVYDEIHPKKNVATKKFDKPKGPAGRGPRRMAKT